MGVALVESVREISKGFIGRLRAASLLSLTVMTLGSFVRANDAGLSCPDWPLCYGKLVPIFDFRIFLEWFHRLLAGILCVLVVAVAIEIARSRQLRQAFWVQAVAATIVLMIQVVLGGLTVLQLVQPTVVSLHLINAVLFLGILIAALVKAETLSIFETSDLRSSVIAIDHSAAEKKTASLLGLALALISVQILWGGSVATHFVGTVCPDFPTCFGQWFPPLSFAVWLQMGHRYLGFAILFIVAILPFVARSVSRTGGYASFAVKTLPLLVVLQLLLGMVNVYASLPAWCSAAHLGNALLIFSVAASGFFELRIQSYYRGRLEIPLDMISVNTMTRVLHGR